jgi:hypothetical protein
MMRPSFLLATLRQLVIYNISRFDVRVRFVYQTPRQRKIPCSN